MERETGLEPATSSLGSWHSTTELLPLTLRISHLADFRVLVRRNKQSPKSLLSQFYARFRPKTNTKSQIDPGNHRPSREHLPII